MNTSSVIRSNQTWLRNTTVSAANSVFVITVQVRYEILVETVILGCLSYFGASVTLLLLVGAWPKSTKSGFDLLVFHFIVLHLCMNLINTPSTLFLSDAVVNKRWVPAHICLYLRPFTSMIEMNINVCDAEMAVNRVVALFFPHHYAKWTSKPVIKGMIIFSWPLCAIFYFAPLVYNSIHSVISMSPLGSCLWSTANSGVINIVSYAVLVITPYTMSGVAAVLILWKTWHLSRLKRLPVALPGAVQIQPLTPTRALQRRLKKSRMLLCTFLWTGLCVTPGAVWAYGGFPSKIANHPMMGWWMRTPRALQFSFTPCILLFYNDECIARLRGMIPTRITSRISATGSINAPGGSVT